MKTMLVAVALALHAIPVHASAPSPLVGRWAIEVATLPMPPEARPKSVVIEFQDPGNGHWTTRVEILNPDGQTMHAQASLPLDGTPGRVSGNYWADVSAIRMPAPGVLVMQLADHGAPASTRIYTVSGDGATLTETKAFFGRDGTPVLQAITFNRMP